MSNYSITQIQLSKTRQNLIIFALSIGAFAIGLSEFSSMGLLLEISRGLGVSESQVGVSISIYALGVVVGAPLLAIFGAGLKRKNLLLALAMMYAIANIASALAPTYGTLLIARFISGLPHGAYFGIASLVAASISPPSQKGMAVTKVMLGLAVAILVGNPLAVWLGQQFTWRLAFALVGVLAFITVLMVNWSLPLDPKEKKTSPMKELAAFNRLQIWLVLLIGVFGFTGMFTVFSYMAPVLVNVTKVSESYMPWLVVAFGVGSIIGMLSGGKIADAMKFKGACLLIVWSIFILAMIPLISGSLPGIIIAAIAVGTMMALPVTLQTHLMEIAGDAQVLSAAAIQAALNTANALGPWLGGMAIDHGLGYNLFGTIGAATSVIGLLIWIASFKLAHAKMHPNQ